MKKKRKLVYQANHLSASVLHEFIVDSNLPLKNDYDVDVYHAKDLSSAYQDEIFDLFERNMKILYEQSKSGYDPEEKRNELFSEQARYIVVSSSKSLIAYAHFRFDMDYDSHVIYLYELQINSDYQKQGLGQWIVEQLKVLCQRTRMLKIVLTVHKENVGAINFYMKKCQFDVDVTDPNDEEDVDYNILSFTI